jgi:predicted phage gp36 major capsid-like protein
MDAVDGALAVGQRLRNAVDEHLDAANAELRARTEAANRDAQVLREVVTILHEHARHAPQRFVERDLRLRALDVVLRDDGDGGRNSIERAIDQRSLDDDFLERALGVCRSLCVRRGCEQTHRSEQRAGAARQSLMRHEILES